MKHLWDNYKQVIFEIFPELALDSVWCEWKSKINLDAKLYKGGYLLKAREAEIYNEKTNIYNMIIYPKTGENLPCFGMDLMGFFEKKVIIVFDFQHPVENFLFGFGDELPIHTGDVRFFQPGNHFSENLYVRKCVASEVDDHLSVFRKYLTLYRDLLYSKKPSEEDVSAYADFDNYMRSLDPVAGYLTSNFGKEKSEDFVNNFLFSYGTTQ
jgi:hypothetical protein